MAFFSITSRYIFRKLLISFLAISPVVIALVWLTMSVKFVGLITSENISLVEFFKLILFILPGLMSTLLPICFLISSIAVLHKMQVDKELIVFMTSGKSVLALFLPFFLMATIVFTFTLQFQTIYSPNSYRQLQSMQEEIRSKISMSILKPGTFNVVGDSVIYMRKITGDRINDVFISYVPKANKSHTNIITAQSGYYAKKDGRIFIILGNGYRQELDKNNVVTSTLKFKTFSYDVTDFFRRFSTKSSSASDKSQQELLNFASVTTNLEQKRNYITEYHSRILSPFIVFINVILVGIFMITPHNRGRKGSGAILSFSCGVLMQIFIMILINSSAKYEGLVLANYYIIACVLVALSVQLVRKSV